MVHKGAYNTIKIKGYNTLIYIKKKKVKNME